jgi:hypothetical protein
VVEQKKTNRKTKSVSVAILAMLLAMSFAIPAFSVRANGNEYVDAYKDSLSASGAYGDGQLYNVFPLSLSQHIWTSLQVYYDGSNYIEIGIEGTEVLGVVSLNFYYDIANSGTPAHHHFSNVSATADYNSHTYKIEYRSNNVWKLYIDGQGLDTVTMTHSGSDVVAMTECDNGNIAGSTGNTISYWNGLQYQAGGSWYSMTGLSTQDGSTHMNISTSSNTCTATKA